MEAAWIWLIPLLPFLGAAINGLLHARYLRGQAPESKSGVIDLNQEAPPPSEPAEQASSWIGTGVMAASFALALAAFFQLLGLPAEERFLSASLGSWIQAGAVDVSWALRIDPLSATLMLVITGVGSLIHLYSTGYMHGDKGFSKYFAYLNLFVGMMLMLVLSDNMLGLFLGWEGVGLCSYLLIGFWYEDGKKADAARKAFLVNRIGDLGFLIGMFLLFWGGAYSLRFGDINAAVGGASPAISPTLATIAALFLFVGCCGKSAQIPLYIWLPDAMAGPTPVSALIHAATMVTSGIYLIARLSPVYAYADGALPVVAIVGGLTALFAATIAIAQRDIKKVLAYSTVSQLGYMFLALGVGAFGVGVYHVVTHAFFKALLFLGAGSVIHAMHHKQDIFDMGGLKDRIPITYKTFMIGGFALAGIPLFSGFFSKDEILFMAASGPTAPWVLWAVGTLGAVLTAVYTGRLLTLTFFGTPRFDPEKVKVHESPRTMTIPLIVLAVLSVAGGLLGIPFVMHPLTEWLEPVTGAASLAVRGDHHGSHTLELILMIVGGAVAIGGLSFGMKRFARNVNEQKAGLDAPTGVLKPLSAAWFVDAIYEFVFVQPLRAIAVLCAAVDVFVIDWAVNRVSEIARSFGHLARRSQSGSLHDYALWLGVGSAILLVVFYLGAS